jgi:hypothetical protein
VELLKSGADNVRLNAARTILSNLASLGDALELRQ